VETSLRLERQRLDAQVQIGQQATDEITRKQAKIVLDAVAIWGELAKKRSDEELQSWYEANVGTGPVPQSRNAAQQASVNGSPI
jgi:hypothetical protein